MIFVIDDDEIMAECVARFCGGGVGDKCDDGDCGYGKGDYGCGNNDDGNGNNDCGCGKVLRFSNAIMAMRALDEVGVPDLIFLDILLDGPDGFTFLNELRSFADTVNIPIVVVTSLDLTGMDLTDYGVVEVLDKSLMVPAEIKRICGQYAR